MIVVVLLSLIVLREYAPLVPRFRDWLRRRS